jgi:hypothetical protein
MSDEGRERLQQLAIDPKLLDLRQSAALSQMLVEQADWEVSDALVESVATIMAARRNGGKKKKRRSDYTGLIEAEEEVDEPPTEADYAKARQAILLERMIFLREHTSIVEKAFKATQVAELLLAEILPIVYWFAERVAQRMKAYIPPDKMAKFMSELDTDIAVLTAKVGDKAAQAKK